MGRRRKKIGGRKNIRRRKRKGRKAERRRKAGRMG